MPKLPGWISQAGSLTHGWCGETGNRDSVNCSHVTWHHPKRWVWWSVGNPLVDDVPSSRFVRSFILHTSTPSISAVLMPNFHWWQAKAGLASKKAYPFFFAAKTGLFHSALCGLSCKESVNLATDSRWCHLSRMVDVESGSLGKWDMIFCSEHIFLVWLFTTT